MRVTDWFRLLVTVTFFVYAIDGATDPHVRGCGAVAFHVCAAPSNVTAKPVVAGGSWSFPIANAATAMTTIIMIEITSH